MSQSISRRYLELRAFNTDASFWLETGKDSLEESLQITEKVLPTHAKNVIIFVGDGMSENTVTAAR